MSSRALSGSRLSLRQYAKVVRQRIDPAHGAKVAMLAGDFRPFAIGVGPDLAGKDSLAHLPQQSLHPIQQRVELVPRQQVRAASIRLAVFLQCVIELAAVAPGRAAIEQRQCVQPEPTRVAKRQAALFAGLAQDVFSILARRVIPP